MAAREESDPIGFDPVRWVERLMDVNQGSQFPPDRRQHIGSVLTALRHQLIAMETSSGNEKPPR